LGIASGVNPLLFKPLKLVMMDHPNQLVSPEFTFSLITLPLDSIPSKFILENS
jgi:hypothetical protein